MKIKQFLSKHQSRLIYSGLLVIFSGAVTLFLIQYFFQNGNISSSFQNSQIESIVYAFEEGIAGSKKGLSKDETCLGNLKILSSFCLQGYYFEKLKSQPWPAPESELANATPDLAIVFGALSHERKLDTAIERLAIADRVKKYFADGWGMSLFFTYKNRLRLQQECKAAFPKKLLPYCLWGGGRGMFLSNNGYLVKSDLDSAFAKGNYFTYYLAGGQAPMKKDDAYLLTNGIKQLLLTKNFKKSTLKQLANCIDENHFLDCATPNQ